jgi:UDP-galactopyranose mutase
LKIDFLIAGAGFSGLVLAERLSRAGARCLLVEKRGEIGGNCLDGHDAHGVLVHRFGPHYFRTNSDLIVRYLSRFTEWRRQDFRILSHTEGRYWSFPVNLTTFEQMIGRESTPEEFGEWLDARRRPVESPSNSEEVVLARAGGELYGRFFRNYTRKQWGREARELAPSVCGRIPVRRWRQEHCFRERFQGLPLQGYHALFARMLESSPGVELLTGTDYRDVMTRIPHSHLVVTGSIDEFFGHRFGPLPYRTLRFEAEHFTGEQLRASGAEGFRQPAVQVNYPGDEEFTRSVEIKHATGQCCEGTTVIREYPGEHLPGTDPYYPVPTPESGELFRRYASEAALLPNVTFLGRLGSFRYLNMDQTVGIALATARRLGRLLGFSELPGDA